MAQKLEPETVGKGSLFSPVLGVDIRPRVDQLEQDLVRQLVPLLLAVVRVPGGTPGAGQARLAGELRGAGAGGGRGALVRTSKVRSIYFKIS